ncbi:MAG TPA: SGNH/GDSL hydrolase family protein [Candidatus Saccharimonadia bacterium]|nr:SGNH/GDSL hydrolase family protein [Candidatus Saccharimonadia bacterium]
MKTLLMYFRITALTLPILLATALSAQVQNAKETDKRLPPGKGGWGVREAEVKDASLPRVLCIGDSILGGYIETVRKELDGKANVDAWVTPVSQASGELPKAIAEILAAHKYDVIHFNLGLHGWQKGRIPDGKFEPLTQKMVDNLRAGAPQAKLIWASTTPVTVKGKPEELAPDINPVILDHNRMAATVMNASKVPINDLYSLMASKLAMASGDQFHWKTEARVLQGHAVSTAIAEQLPKK